MDAERKRKREGKVESCPGSDTTKRTPHQEPPPHPSPLPLGGGEGELTPRPGTLPLDGGEGERAPHASPLLLGGPDASGFRSEGESQISVKEYSGWLGLAEDLRRHEATAMMMMEWFKKRAPELTAERVQEMGQQFFSEMALTEKNGEAWNRTQEVGVKMDRNKLGWERFWAQERARKEEARRALRRGRRRRGGIRRSRLEEMEEKFNLM